MNDKIEELREQVEIARKAFEEHPSIRTGSMYGDALEQLENAMKNKEDTGIGTMWIGQVGMTPHKRFSKEKHTTQGDI